MTTSERLALQWARFRLHNQESLLWWGARITVVVTAVLMTFASIQATQWWYEQWVVQKNFVLPLTQELIQGNSGSRAAFAPQQLSISPVEVVSHSSTSSIDAIAYITNPNRQWVAFARAVFVAGGSAAIPQEITIAPQSTRVLASSIILSSPSVSAASLLVEEIHWKRAIPSPLPITDRAIALETTMIDEVSGETFVIAEIKNKTLFRFREVQMLLRWYEGSTLTGSRIFSVSDLLPGERKRIVFSSDRSIPSFARFVVDPLFDPADPNARQRD